MKARVAIARALAMQPDVLLMDEPFAALDALTRRRMQEELQALWEEARFTMLFVTHSIEEALVVGNRILLLSPHPGRVRAEINSHQFGLHSAGSANSRPRRGASTACCSARRRAGRTLRRPAPSTGSARMNAQWDPPVRPEYELPLAAAAGAGADIGAERPFTPGRAPAAGRLAAQGPAAGAAGRAVGSGGALDRQRPAAAGRRADRAALARAWSRASCRAMSACRCGCCCRATWPAWPAPSLLTSLAMSTRAGRDLLETLTAMFNPLPAIALLPLALLWFGLGKGSLVFVLMHSVMWPLALNAYAGFRAVPETLRMAGRNYGLGGLRMVLQILVPAALPAILSGLKIGWAFAWRTLIAAELVFGTTSGRAAWAGTSSRAATSCSPTRCSPAWPR
jgi:hypothetical protein